MPIRIAIVGSGISGLAAFWALNKDIYEVHLYECNDYFGGHSHSVQWKDTNVFVDTGFTLFNDTTYPNFSKFLEMLDIPKSPTRITFGVSRDSGQFEWSSRSIFTIFHQWRCIFSLERWALLYDMCRFNLLAHEVLIDHDRYNEETVSGYLKQNGYSNSFKNNCLFPLLSSIWIHDPDTAVGLMPIAMVVQYLWNHRLLYNTFSETIQWWTIKGAAKRYVEKILDSCPRDRLHKDCKITSIVTEPKEPKEPKELKGHVKLCLHGDPESVQYFDQVIVASSAPDALEMLRDATTPEERDVLKNFKVSQPNEVVLHEDERLMPRKPTLWSAWNYHISSFSRACLTANMTEVMDITDFDKPILATLNPNPEMFPKGTTATFYFRHPIYDNLTAQAQHDMEQIQGKRGVWYAGAWMGHGFHEDGFTKGVEAAMQIRRQIEPNFSQDSVFPLKDWKNAERRPPVHTAIRIKRIFPGTRHGIVFFFSLILGLLLFLKP